MSRFDSFLLCGVLQHIPVCETEHILLTDYYGNLEGWTNLIGDEFNFDCLAGSECRLYNVLPLFPALVKYMPTEAVTRVKTIFFKVCNTREQSLVLVEADRPFNDKERDIWIKQLDAFQHLMSKD